VTAKNRSQWRLFRGRFLLQVLEERRISGRCGRRLIAVVDCSHALQEKKDEEQANEVKDRQKTGEASEEGGQQQTIKQEDILESKYGPQEENPSAPSATVGVFLGQRRRSFLSAIRET
jgi:hypothetical protein